MTGKVTRTTHTLSVIAQLLGVLTVLVALAALAQTRGTGQRSRKSHAVPVSSSASAGLLAQGRPGLPGGINPECSSACLSCENGIVAPSVSGPPFFSQPVIYASGGTNVTYSVAVGDVNGD